MLLFLSCAVHHRIASCSGCAASGLDDAEVRQARLEQIKGNILAQLSLDLPEGGEDVNPTQTPLELLELEKEYNRTIKEYWDLMEETTPELKCTSDEFYAQPISSFIGDMAPTEGE